MKQCEFYSPRNTKFILSRLTQILFVEDIYKETSKRWAIGAGNRYWLDKIGKDKYILRSRDEQPENFGKVIEWLLM